MSKAGNPPASTSKLSVLDRCPATQATGSSWRSTCSESYANANSQLTLHIIFFFYMPFGQCWHSLCVILICSFRTNSVWRARLYWCGHKLDLAGEQERDTCGHIQSSIQTQGGECLFSWMQLRPSAEALFLPSAQASSVCILYPWLFRHKGKCL